MIDIVRPTLRNIWGSEPNPPRDIFINAGQSNVDGARPIAELPAQYQQTYTRTKFYRRSADNTFTFIPLDWTVEESFKAGNLTIGSYYADQFFLFPQIQALLNKDIYVVHHALGGTALNIEWKPTATVGNLYKELIFKIKSTINMYTDTDGVAPNFRFMYWGQGENDARTQIAADAYQTNLTNFINNIRSQTGLTNLPFLIGRLNSGIAASGPYDFWATVRAAQEAVCQGGSAAISGVYLVNQDNAQLNSADFVHYTTTGYLTIASNILSVAQTNGLI